MAPVLVLLLVTKALATGADSDSYVLDSGAGEEQCHEDEATSLLQVKYAVKRSIGSGADNRTEASRRSAAPGPVSGPLDPVPKPDTCSMVSVAGWASYEIYRTWNLFDLFEGDFEEMISGNSEEVDKQWGSWMQAAGWTRDLGLSIDGTDGVGFWTHAANGDCILAFRGSDQLQEVLQSTVLRESLPGFDSLQLAPGVKAEFEEYFAALKEKVGGSDAYAREGFKKYTDKCPGGIIAAGHSLGGGVAQLFAYFANKNGDPLKMKLPYKEGVKAVYGYGALTVGYERTGFLNLGTKELTNDKRADGCFPGGIFASAYKTDKDKFIVDWATVDMNRQGLMGQNLHVKSSVSLVYEKGATPKTYKCGDGTEWWKEVTSSAGPLSEGELPDLHQRDVYSNKIGCM